MFCLMQHYNHAYVQANAAASLWIFHLAALKCSTTPQVCGRSAWRCRLRTTRRCDRSELCFSDLTGSLGAQRFLFIYRGLECVQISVIFIQGRYTVKNHATGLLGRTWPQGFQVFPTVQKAEQEKDQNQRYESQVCGKHLFFSFCLSWSLFNWSSWSIKTNMLLFMWTSYLWDLFPGSLFWSFFGICWL